MKCCGARLLWFSISSWCSKKTWTEGKAGIAFRGSASLPLLTPFLLCRQLLGLHWATRQRREIFFVRIILKIQNWTRRSESNMKSNAISMIFHRENSRSERCRLISPWFSLLYYELYRINEATRKQEPSKKTWFSVNPIHHTVDCVVPTGLIVVPAIAMRARNIQRMKHGICEPSRIIHDMYSDDSYNML